MVALYDVMAVASTPQAVAKSFGPMRLLAREIDITSAAQHCNTDMSMMIAEELMANAKVKVIAHKDERRREVFIPSVKSWAEAASLVRTMCANGTRLRHLVDVGGSGGRSPFAFFDE